MIISESEIVEMINEEITKSDIRSISSSMLDSFLKSNDFKRQVRGITCDVMEEFFDALWRKKMVLKGLVRR